MALCLQAPMSSSQQNGAKIQAAVYGAGDLESSSVKIATDTAPTVPSGNLLLTGEVDRDAAAIKKAADSFLKSKALTVLDSKPDSYPKVWGISDAYEIFNLDLGSLSPEDLDRARNTVLQHIDRQRSRFLGYQSNMHVDAQKYVSHYLDSSLNNVGDPFTENNSTVNTKFMERAVLDYYATLWNATTPHSKDNLESYWGFLLTMGSTEGNLYGMWNARDYLSGKKMLVNVEGGGTTIRIPDQGRVNVPRFVYQSAPLSQAVRVNAYTPIAFYSEDTHYSISKTMVVLGIRTFSAEGSAKYPGECPLNGTNGVWPAEVPSNDDGTVNIEALKVLVEFFASRGYPIIVNFNYGTTFKGAYDDVGKASEELTPILKKYGLYEREVHWNEEDPEVYDIRSGFWFHVDGALGAAYMPYVEMAYNNPDGPLIDKKGPLFDFRLPTVHSISMSGHKWLGASMPTGVYMTKVKYQMNPPDIPEYIGNPDTTFAGSRNGLSAMILWDNLARHSLHDQIKKSLDLLKLAETAEKMLRQLQDDVLHEDLRISRSDLSLSIHFKRINDNMCKKYSVSNATIDGLQYSRIFIMGHVTEPLLSEFVKDLKFPGAFEYDPPGTEVAERTVIGSVARAKGLVAPSFDLSLNGIIPRKDRMDRSERVSSIYIVLNTARIIVRFWFVFSAVCVLRNLWTSGRVFTK